MAVQRNGGIGAGSPVESEALSCVEQQTFGIRHGTPPRAKRAGHGKNVA